jgi:hypothetical protein
MWIECARDNPKRVVHWRWLRALAVATDPDCKTSRREDGPVGYRWIKRAANFKIALDRARTPHRQRVLRTKMPDLWWAYQLWNDDRDPARSEVEARILARCDNFEIGLACGIPPEVIDAYECVFFNVREKLNHSGYIGHQVSGPAVQRGLAEHEYDALWKLYAYFRGPQVLQSLISKFVCPSWCSTPDTVNSALQDDAIGTLKLKASVAAKTVPVGFNTQTELLHIFTKFVEVERTTDTAGRAQDQMLEHITAMLAHLPLNISGRDPQHGHVPIAYNPVQQFKQTAIELSYEEIMAVATGQELSYLEQVQTLKFPEPPTFEGAGGTHEQDQ